MHIAYYSPDWPADGAANGIVTYVHQMRGELLARGHSVTVVSRNKAFFDDGSVRQFEFSRPLWGRAIDRARKIVSREDFFNARNALAILHAFREVDRRKSIDIVEIEESFGWSHQIQLGLKVPVVTRLHGPHFLGQCDVESPEDAILSARRNALEGKAIASARWLTSPSQSLLQATLEEYGTKAHQVRTIPNPVPPVEARECWSLEACERDLILCVGRFDRRKGADIALEAFARALQVRPELRLVMVGTDSGLQVDGRFMKFTEYCDRFVPESVRKSVSHLGVLRPAEIAGLRRRAFLTMVCSRFENFPYAIAEAMALGCPIVATRSFGNGEMLEHGESGWLVEAENAGEMAAAVESAFSAPAEAARRGRAAWDKCREHYAPSVVVDETLRFYGAALA